MKLFYYIVLLFLALPQLAFAAPKTTYINCGCGNNGDGTAGTCAASGGAAGAYNTGVNWESAERKNLVTATETHTVIFKGTTACSHVPNLTTANWTSSDTYRVIFTVEEADRAFGVWDTNKPRILSNASSGINWPIECSGVHCSVINMQLKHESSFYGRGGVQMTGSVAGSWIAAGNLIWGSYSTSSEQNGLSCGVSTGKCLFYNNIIYGFETATSSRCIRFEQNKNGYAYHNTLSDCDRGIGVDGASGTQVVKNNIINSIINPYDGTPNADLIVANYNVMTAASDTGSGANDVFSATLTFVSSTDYHLSGANASAVISNNLYADGNIPMTLDIDGSARPSSGNIYAGADEIASAVVTHEILLLEGY